MAINPYTVPVYTGSPFDKVESIMMGAVLGGEKFKLKRKEAISPKKFRDVVEVLLDKIYRDPDTGLPNYESFRESLEKLLAKRERKRTENATLPPDQQLEIPKDTVLFFDMNYMKNLNTEIGMQKTDKLIATIAEILHDSFRAKTDPSKPERVSGKKFNADIVARAKKGGDEFLVLMRGCSREDAKKKADMIFEKIKSKYFIIPDNSPRSQRNALVSNVSLSYGYYELDSKLNANIEEDHDTAETALAKAEELMKQRKERWKKPEDGRITPPIIQKGAMNTINMLVSQFNPDDVTTIRVPPRAIRI